MKSIFRFSALFLTFVAVSLAQSPTKAEPQFSGDITGLYSFVHEGEFVQIEVNDGKVTGVISRFKNEDLDKPEFVDQFFEQAKLEGSILSFRTKPAEGVWFEFSGVVERGPAKTPSDEGYWNVRGKLLERRTEADGMISEKPSELTLRSFPQEIEPDADKK
jgi:hypothetical protein